MADTTPKAYSADPTLYLYTSLTAGSSHIITATSRLETILKANKISFRALDVATDEKARMLWGRRSKGRKLPGLVRYGSVVGDLEEIEEWNEYGELKQQIGSVPAVTATPVSSNSNTPSKGPRMPSATAPDSSPGLSPPAFDTRSVSPARSSQHIQIRDPPVEETSSSGTPKKDETPLTLAMRQAGEEAAKKAGEKKTTAKPTLLQTEASGISASEAKKLDDSAAIPPPSGTTETGAATKPTPVTADKDEEVAQPSAAAPRGMRTSITEDTELKSSPLTQEAAAESTPSLSAEKPSDESSPIYQHRGSSVSIASREEIAEVERSLTIKEEDEGEEGGACLPTTEESDPASGGEKMSEAAGKEEEKEPAGKKAEPGTTSLSADKKGEAPAPVEPKEKTQEQDAKGQEDAGKSVGD